MQRDLAIRGIAVLILPEFCFSYECGAGLLKKLPFSDGECLNTNLELTVHRGALLLSQPGPFFMKLKKTLLHSYLYQNPKHHEHIIVRYKPKNLVIVLRSNHSCL